MRSRTEMVTTTFVDSEEDYSDDDDSEEDWRPSASGKNGKKPKHPKSAGGSGKRGRKRKGPAGAGGVNAKNTSKRKPAYEDSDDEDEVEEEEVEEDEVSDDEYEQEEMVIPSGSMTKKPNSNLPPKKQFSEKNNAAGNGSGEGEQLKLMVYIKDLAGDYSKNSRLCLWRKDSNNLLQKYIRVKTTPEEYLFTSSSVYSSFDDKRISDFYDISVKCLDSSKRRVKISNPSELKRILAQSMKDKATEEGDADSDADLLDDDESDDISESELEKKQEQDSVNENKENMKRKNLKMKLLEKNNRPMDDDDEDEEDEEDEVDEEENEHEDEDEEDEAGLQADEDEEEEVEEDENEEEDE